MSWRVANLVKSKVLGKTINPDGRPCSAIMRKLVLLAYADVAAHDGSGVFVAKTTVALEHEINRSSVVTATQSLLDDGLIAVDDSRYPGGRKPGREGYTMVYRIVISRVRELPDGDPEKCRNSDTLDDATVEGDEPLGRVMSERSGPVDKWAKVSRRPPLKVSKSHAQSVDVIDMNLPHRNIKQRAHDSGHRLADPEYARERDANPPAPVDAEADRLARILKRLRAHVATLGRGEEITGDPEWSGVLPKIAARNLRTRIAEIEQHLAKGSTKA